MRFDGFINGSYPSSAAAVDQEQCINLFPELIAGDGGGAGERWVLKRTPGAKVGITLSDSPVRGMLLTQDRLFVVSGFTLFEIAATGNDRLNPAFTSANRGTLTTVAGPLKPAILKATSAEVFILADGFGYVFNLRTFVFAKVTAPAFPANANALAMIDTYFIVNNPGYSTTANQFSISSPLAGLSWSSLDFGSSQEPDVIVGLAELHLSLWVFGRKRVVIFQNTGAASFPFQRIPGAVIDIGLAAAYSVQNLDNTLYWLGSNEAGSTVVYRADGMLPTRVSNHALEYAMQRYSVVSDAVSSTYQEEGHLFYRLDFPSGNSTWVYDVSTKRWHQRGLWDTVNGFYNIDPARYHAECQNIWHVAGDYRSGVLYGQTMELGDWAGAPIRWLRRAPPIVDAANRARMFYRRFEVIWGMPNGAYSGPFLTVVLRWSDDAGQTFSASHSMTHATPGDYYPRAVFRRLGTSRSRVFELSGGDAVPRLVIAGVDLQIEKGTS